MMEDLGIERWMLSGQRQSLETPNYMGMNSFTKSGSDSPSVRKICKSRPERAAIRVLKYDYKTDREDGVSPSFFHEIGKSEF